MHIGFTGTRQGMTERQRSTVTDQLRAAILSCDGPLWFHHGDCCGADAEFQGIARSMSRFLSRDFTVVVHPPTHTRQQAGTAIPGDEVRPSAPYLERNHHIVDMADLMLAAPAEVTEQLRSGTWATVRYAHKMRKPTIICYPNGMAVES